MSTSAVSSTENSEVDFTVLEPPSPRSARPLQPVASCSIEGKKNPLKPISANVIPKNLPISKARDSNNNGSFSNKNGFIFPEEQQEKVVETLLSNKATKHMPLTPLRQQPAGRHLGGTRRGSSAQRERAANPALLMDDEERGTEKIISEEETKKMMLRAAQVGEGVNPHTPSPQHGVRPGNGPKRGGRPNSFARKDSDAPPAPTAGGGNPRASFSSRRVSTVSEASQASSVHCNKCLDLGEVAPLVEESGYGDEDEDEESEEVEDEEDEDEEEEEGDIYTVVPIASSSDHIDHRVHTKAEEIVSCGFNLALGAGPVAQAAATAPVEPETLSHEDLFFFQAVEEAEETALPPLHVASYFSPPPPRSCRDTQESDTDPGIDLEQEDILGLLGTGAAGFGIGGTAEADAKDPPPRRHRTETTPAIADEDAEYFGAAAPEDSSINSDFSPLPSIGGKYAVVTQNSAQVSATATADPYSPPRVKLPPVSWLEPRTGSMETSTARSVSTTESMAFASNHRELMALEIEEHEDNQRALMIALEDEMWQALVRAFGHELSCIYAWELQSEEAAKKRLMVEMEEDKEKKRMEEAEAENVAYKSKLAEEATQTAKATAAAATQPQVYTDRGSGIVSDYRLVELGDNQQAARARRYASVANSNDITSMVEAAQGDSDYLRMALTSASKNWIAVHLDQYNQYYRFSWYYRKGLAMLARFQHFMDAKVRLLNQHFMWECRILHKETQLHLMEEYERDCISYLALRYFPEVVAHAWDKSLADRLAKQSLNQALLMEVDPATTEMAADKREEVAAPPAVAGAPLPPPPKPVRGRTYQRSTPGAEGASATSSRSSSAAE